MSNDRVVVLAVAELNSGSRGDAVFQVGVALLLFFITWRYVRLTRDLVRAAENQGRLSETLLVATNRQIELQNRATRIGLYDRHLKIYTAIRWFLNEFHPHMQLEMDKLFRFDRETKAAMRCAPLLMTWPASSPVTGNGCLLKSPPGSVP